MSKHIEHKSNTVKESAKYYTVDGGGKSIHLCTGHRHIPICGTHLNFPERGNEVKLIDWEIRQKWGDDKLQSVKWVLYPEYEYCKRCVAIWNKAENDNKTQKILI